MSKESCLISIVLCAQEVLSYFHSNVCKTCPSTTWLNSVVQFSKYNPRSLVIILLLDLMIFLLFLMNIPTPPKKTKDSLMNTLKGKTKYFWNLRVQKISKNSQRHTIYIIPALMHVFKMPPNGQFRGFLTSGSAPRIFEVWLKVWENPRRKA